MTHPRKTIRDHVQGIILNGGTLAGKEVYTNRKHHIDDNTSLPQVVIHTESEAIELMDQAPRRYKRDLSVVIEIFARGTTELSCQDTLDQLAWQVENLLGNDDDWGGTVNHVHPESVRMEFQETGTKPIGCCIITYKAEYLTETTPIEDQTVAELTDLDAIQGSGPDFGWDIVVEEGDPDGAIDAELLIETET